MLDRSFVFRLASSTAQVYQSAYDSIERSLGMDMNKTTPKTLAIQHGCDALVEPTEFIIQSFSEKYVSSLTEDQRRYVSVKDPALVAAAFSICAIAFKVPLSRLLPPIYLFLDETW